MSETIPILGVAGRPVLHSMSPLIFRELFHASGAKAAYTRVAASSAAEAIFLFRALGMRGMNLTSPLKEEAAAALAGGLAGGIVAELSAEARKLGAVNCLLPLEGGGIRGDNTDPQGVLGGLGVLGVEIAGRRCLVLGAGGAGKAAAFALARAGGEVVVANRTRSRADEVAALLGCASASLDELPELARGAEVIVSTLASEALPDPEAWFPSGGPTGGLAGRCAAVLDADYKTGRLARFAASRGVLAATGADWLVAQALPAYELFMGGAAPSGEALAALLSSSPRAYAKGRKIALIGLMGSGKTRVGRALAARMDLPFVDADDEIEAEAAATIPEIFAREGESGFRAREARVIDRITSSPGAVVVATGGGAAASGACAPLLAERCAAAWLYATPATAARRTREGAGASRPLLAVEDPERRLEALEAERRGAYAACAELLVSTEGRGFEEVAEVLHDEIDRLS
jgi:shikimate dehydrogenase